ncbi:MAG: DMT family transporter [Firmicutes bacterium]|nr:DMT family transporter [Bacillota bacterium]
MKELTDEMNDERKEASGVSREASFWTRPAVFGSMAVLCTLLWGSAFPSIKYCYRFFDIGSGDTGMQLFVAGMRFALAGVIVILIRSLACKRLVHPAPGNWGRAVKLGLVQTGFHYMFYYIGLANTTGVHSAIITASSNFFGILIAVLIYRSEKMTGRKALGCLLGFGGILVTNLAGSSIAGGSLFGDLMVICASLCSGLSMSMTRKYAAHEDAVVLSGYSFLIGGIGLLLTSFLLDGVPRQVNLPAILIMGYMVLICAVAYTIWNVLLKHNSVGKVAVFGFLTPVFGVILSAIFLGEAGQALNIFTLIALLLVCCGILIVNVHKHTARQ